MVRRYGMTRKVRRTGGGLTRKMRRPGARKPVARLSKPVKRAVNSIINRKLETKYIAQDMLPINENGTALKEIYGDTVPAGPAQVFPVCPDVAEGTSTTEYTREGVKIQPTGLQADLMLFFNNLRKDVGGASWIDQCSWDINVHIWYGYCRKYKQNSDIVANSVLIAENLLDEGNGSTRRFTGTPLEQQFKLNKEYMVGMKHRVVRMYRPLGTQNDATTNGGLTSYWPQTINKLVKLKFKTPKSLLFNETNDQPENYAPFVIIGYCHNDNTLASNTYTAPGTQPANVLNAPALLASIKSHLWFKDA